MRSTFAVDGRITLTIRDKSGSVEKVSFPNHTTPLGGRTMLHRLVANQSDLVMDRVRVYDSVLDTGSAIGTTGMYEDLDISPDVSDSGARVVLSGTAFFGQANFTWRSADLVLSDGATALARSILPTPREKTNTQSIAFEWDLRVRTDV